MTVKEHEIIIRMVDGVATELVVDGVEIIGLNGFKIDAPLMSPVVLTIECIASKLDYRNDG